MADHMPEPLGGSLKVSPGLARPFNLTSTRPDWADRLTQGKALSSVPNLLASLFNLCGHAHRLCATLAIQAARGQAAPLDTATRRSLQTETLREHLRRICLDWPLQLAASAEVRASAQEAAHKALRACPVAPGISPVPQAALKDFSDAADWLGHLLGGPPSEWLGHWEQAPHGWMRHWCASTPGWLPELLQNARTAADTPMPGLRALQVHACDRDLLELADQLHRSPSFSRQPCWHRQCAETGPWTRLNQQHPEGFDTPWLRLGARLAELVRLCLPDEPRRSGAQWLQAGSVCAGRNEGLAWVEMARGLLIHFIRIDGHGTDARAHACRVLAPTEWNFHPQGAIAQVLETLPRDLTPAVEQRIRALMTAFDPCVRFELPLRHFSRENTYA